MGTTDISDVVTTAFANYTPELLTVGTAGLGIAFIVWGLPKAVGFFKRLA